MAGFDAIIIEGQAEKPVYISIKDGEASLKDAGHLWGMNTLECENTIREELGDKSVKVAQIGPGGENLVRYASVMNDLDAAAGRTGMGAVMGSKKLKAIACRGTRQLPLADPDAVRELSRWIRDHAPATIQRFRDLGTAQIVDSLQGLGGLPTRNFQFGSFEGAEKITGETMADTILVKRRACHACPVQCKREVKVDEPYQVDPRYGGPEYETIGSLGSDCGIDDLKAIAMGNQLCNAYGLDSISCGATIAFAMECFENGLISKEDTGGIELRFGNAEAMLETIEQIGRRKGFGDTLAEGVARAAKEIGKGAEKYALHIKGQELPMHEPRLKQGLGVGYSISPTGADHCHNIHDTAYVSQTGLMEDIQSLGVLEPMEPDDLSGEKMQLLSYYANWIHFLNSAVCCYFVMSLGRVGFERTSKLVNAATGWNTSVFEILKVGERAVNLARVFNVREGFTVKDDSMPERFFTPHPSGPLPVALDREAFEKAKEMYYELMSWPDGTPSAGKLAELGVEWAIPMLKK